MPLLQPLPVPAAAGRPLAAASWSEALSAGCAPLTLEQQQEQEQGAGGVTAWGRHRCDDGIMGQGKPGPV
jgi:hypothetical protein